MAKKPKAPASRTMKMKRLSSFVDDMVEPSARKRGFALSRLVAHWGEIVGDMASWCKPVELSLGRENNNGNLKLSIVSGRGPEAQQMTPVIIDRVNASFGYAAISRISFVQTMSHEPITTVTPDHIAGATAHKLASESDDEAADIWTLDDKLSGIKSPELRAALRRLGTPIGSSDDSD